EALGWLFRKPAPRPADPPHWQVNPEVHRLFADRAGQEANRRATGRDLLAQLAGGGGARGGNGPYRREAKMSPIWKKKRRISFISHAQGTMTTLRRSSASISALRADARDPAGGCHHEPPSPRRTSTARPRRTDPARTEMFSPECGLRL